MIDYEEWTKKLRKCSDKQLLEKLQDIKPEDMAELLRYVNFAKRVAKLPTYSPEKQIEMAGKTIEDLRKYVAQLETERNKAMEFVNGHHQEVDKLRKTNAKLEAILRLYLAGQLP